MATQFALSIEHILDNIFNNLVCDIPTSLDGFCNTYKPLNSKSLKDEWIRRRTLISASLTCKAFSEPASKVIWTSLHRTGLEPLVKLYWNMQATALGGVHSVTGLSQRQWERWEHVAARVRCVVYDPERYDLHSAKNSVYLLRTLQARYDQTERALFPRLRTLVWSAEGDPEDEDWLGVLASPSAPVSSLYFRSQWNPWRGQLRASISRYPYTLRKLGCFITRNPDFLVFVLPLLSVLPKLEVLTVHDIKNINVCKLPGSKAVLLPALQELHLPFARSEHLAPLFDCLSCPRLRMIYADLPVHTNFENTEQDLKQFSTHPLVRQLTMLDVSFALLLAVDNLHFSAMIAPLLSLPVRQLSLTLFKPKSTPTICPTPQDLERITRAWPLLSSFKIAFDEFDMTLYNPASRPPRPSSALPSLSAVLAFVLACPALRVLQLELIQDVTAEELATAEETVRVRKPQLNLEYLELVSVRYERQVTIADPARLARVLRSVFPQLWSVRCFFLVDIAPPGLKRDGVVSDYDRLADCFDGSRRGALA